MTDRWAHGIGMTSQRTRDRLIMRLKRKGISNRRVLDAMRHTPRHLFVDEALASRAYEDSALSIGHRQTISQPYVVARMTEALLTGFNPGSVLEVGTGSGYQTALLAQLVRKVYTVERIPELYRLARQQIQHLKFSNVRFKLSDGSWGWEGYAPFDAILVTAAPEEIPESLLKQLALGGRMIIPLGGERDVQQLSIINRTADHYERKNLEAVSFVPFVQGAHLG